MASLISVDAMILYQRLSAASSLVLMSGGTIVGAVMMEFIRPVIKWTANHSKDEKSQHE